MKNIFVFDSPKYNSGKYRIVQKSIYAEGDMFFTSLSFEQEPELGEGNCAANLSQYPLEDVLDKFSVHISDFYQEKNTSDSDRCYLEFASSKQENIEKLLSIVDRHVYLKHDTEDGEEVEVLIIE